MTFKVGNHEKLINITYMEIISRTTAVALLIILLPFLLIIGLGNLILQGRPIIYRQKRVGKDFQEFMIYKFRTMKNEDSGIDNFSSESGSVITGVE